MLNLDLKICKYSEVTTSERWLFHSLTVLLANWLGWQTADSVEQCFFNTCISYKHFETAGTIMGNYPWDNNALTTNKITQTYAYKEVLRIPSVAMFNFD